jgi:hypothetical protein
MRAWVLEDFDSAWVTSKVKVSVCCGASPIRLLLAVRSVPFPEVRGPVVVIPMTEALAGAASVEVALTVEETGSLAGHLSKCSQAIAHVRDLDGDGAVVSVDGAALVITANGESTVSVVLSAEAREWLVAVLEEAAAHRAYLDGATLTWEEEVRELLADLTPRERATEEAIAAVSRQWPELPDDYFALVRLHNGGSGSLCESWLRLYAIEDLVEENEACAELDHLADLVTVGSDGGGAVFGFDRSTATWVEAPMIGGRGDFASLGVSILDALRELDRPTE